MLLINLISCKTNETEKADKVFHPRLPLIHNLDHITVEDGADYGLDGKVVLSAVDFSKLTNHLEDLYDERDRRIDIINYYRDLLAE